jgi:hypothetical protein
MLTPTDSTDGPRRCFGGCDYVSDRTSRPGSVFLALALESPQLLEVGVGMTERSAVLAAMDRRLIRSQSFEGHSWPSESILA